MFAQPEERKACAEEAAVFSRAVRLPLEQNKGDSDLEAYSG